MENAAINRRRFFATAAMAAAGAALAPKALAENERPQIQDHVDRERLGSAAFRFRRVGRFAANKVDVLLLCSLR